MTQNSPGVEYSECTGAAAAYDVPLPYSVVNIPVKTAKLGSKNLPITIGEYRK